MQIRPTLLKVSIFFLLSVICNGLNAQPKYLQFDNVANGVTTNFVTSIFQDSRGWIWFTSAQGLNKFDGSRIRTYKISKEDTSNFFGNQARFIFEDSKGTLWVGSDNGGLFIFNRDHENFKPCFEQDKQNKAIYFDARSIAEDKDGNLWIGTNEGLKKYDKKTRKYLTYKSSSNDPNSAYSNFIAKTIIDRKGKIWLGTMKGIDRFDPITGSFEHIPLSGNSNQRPFISEIFEDVEGKIWIGSFSDGLYLLDSKTNLSKRIVINNGAEFSNSIRSILQSRNGEMWIGTSAGLYIYSPKNNSFSHFSHDQKDPLSLSHNSIFCVSQDKQENIWLGTKYGISYMVPQKQVFHFYNTFANNDDSNNNGVNAFWADAKSIWIATDYSGINILNTNKQAIKSLSAQKHSSYGLSSNTIKSLIDDKKGNVWICYNSTGIDVYNIKNGTIKKYINDPANSKSLSSNWIGGTYLDKKGNLWIGTIAGLDRYNPQNDGFIHYGKTVTDRWINWISEDSEGNLWLGSFSEIIIFNPTQNKIKKIKTKHQTVAFIEDKYNQIWLATANKGLALVDKNKLDIIKYYDESSGIANNSISSMIEDDENTIWISTANGLSRFFPDQKKFENYYKEDGTRITTYNYRSCYKLSSGELMFGGYNGFVTFNPKELKDNDYPPPVELTDFRISNQSVIAGAKESPLEKHIGETKSIVLNYNQNFISFRYSALNYNSPYKNKYAYKLEGVDKDWNYVNERRDANYTNLEPGEYQFKVKTSTNSTNWSEKGVTIKIKIVPPIYKTWYFQISTLLLLFSLTVILIRKRINYIKNKNKILELLVFEKTKDLQQLTIELEESQSEVMAQNEEIEKQNESLTDLNERIFRQNEELKHYAGNLENKVIERTKELEIAKNKAEESDKLKSAIMTNMSHEIRTPMNSIVGLSNLLMQEGFSEEERKFFSTNIRRNCDILLHLINDILDLSIIEAGKLPLHFTEFNLNNLLNDIYEIFKADKQWLEKSHLDFTLHVPSEKLHIKTDKVRVEQIVRNLLHNAFKFTEEGQIELGFKITMLDVIIYVKDSGVGIPPDKTETIFDRFVKLQVSSAKYDFGVGLGLAICSKLTSMLHGKIWVESKLGEGSTFFFSLPINKSDN